MTVSEEQKKAVVAAALVIAGSMQALLGAGCQYVSPEQVVQAIDLGHEAYHIVHPERECLIALPMNEDGSK